VTRLHEVLEIATHELDVVAVAFGVSVIEEEFVAGVMELRRA
jgi:hypothetical protein